MRYKVEFEFDYDGQANVAAWYWPDILSGHPAYDTTLDTDTIKVFRFLGWEEL